MLAGIACGGLIVVLVSQASSPDYRALWWSCLPCAIAFLVADLGFGFLVKAPIRWVSVLILAMASLSFAEFTLRVWR
jgi:hypothetical protein